jgi:hypothetical protein
VNACARLDPKKGALSKTNPDQCPLGDIRLWWGRWDLNPGCQRSGRTGAPQAGILDHSRRLSTENLTVPPYSHKLDYDPIKHNQTENLIINTIIYAKAEGKADNTQRSIDKCLRQLSKAVNLQDPETVKTYISNALHHETKEPLSNATKNKLCFAYDWLCKSNNLPTLQKWQKPFYKVEEETPLIPTTENVNKIVGASSKKYATIFTILAETAAEGEELHKTRRAKIGPEQGIISITGTKGHDSGNYKLKTRTSEMLREYMKDNTNDYPFPRPKIMSIIWQRVRNRLAKNLNQPELRNIPMKNLRNYAGAIFYETKGKHDPIATMRFMRHKKLETTMHYIRAINLDEPDDYTSRAVQLGTPDTQKQILELLNAGFDKVTEADGYQYFRKLGKQQ